MSATSKIEWTDRTWNPVRGCSIVSPGCVNCYAMKQAHRFSGPGRAYEGLTKLTKAGPQWTGKVRPVEAALLEPLSWRNPALVFVNSMSDLFHEAIPYTFIDRVFHVMQQAERHTFQVLTKRADRMRAYVQGMADLPDGRYRGARVLRSEGFPTTAKQVTGDGFPWPLPNVWLGVSVEGQDQLERIDSLKDTPAAVHFVSFEPLLEDLGALILDGIEWAIIGGESGSGARPFELAWARSIVAQCKGVGVPVFVKQLGAKPRVDGPPGDDRTWILDLASRKGGDPSEWPEDLRVREFPEVRA